MSRIGKKEIQLPDKVSGQLSDGGMLTITGPLGSLSRPFPAKLRFEQAGGVIKIEPVGSSHQDRSLWGTYGAHLKNMITGVVSGFTKVLLIEGIGYRAAVAGDALTLNIGFSHPVMVPIPPGLKVAVDKNQITVSGLDKEQVGQLAATIRAHKRTDPYKGKGIRYEDEFVRRKVGKKVAAG